MGIRVSRSLRLLLLFCLALAISGCTTKLAYDHLDWFAAWKVQRLVKLDSEPKEQTKQAIQKFHAWHRKTQLPQYAAYLSALQERVNKGDLSAADIHAETDKVQLLLEESLMYILPDAAAVLSQLSQAKADELLSSITEERQEYIDEYVNVSADKQLENRYDKFHGHFKDWLGRPSKQQRKQIEAWAKSLEPFETGSAKQRKVLEQQFAALLAQRQDVEALEKGLKGLVFYRSDTWAPDLKEVVDRNQARTYELIADLLNNMSDKQREHFNKKAESFVQIFNDLNKEAQ